jgi:hypothetical protein
MFQVDITDLINNKFQLMVQDTKVTTNIVDEWSYWEYEMFIKLLNQKNKEEKEEKDKQDGEQNKMSNFNPSKMMGQYNPSKFTGGNMSKFPRL